MTTRDLFLRTVAGFIALTSGIAQVASLWILPTTPDLLITALSGSFYVILALGLFGVSRFSLFLGVVLPLLRGWFELWPLPLVLPETLRTAADLLIVLLCVPVFWSSLRPGYDRARARLFRARASGAEDPGA